MNRHAWLVPIVAVERVPCRHKGCQLPATQTVIEVPSVTALAHFCDGHAEAGLANANSFVQKGS
jgi:hypothetical protein